MALAQTYLVHLRFSYPHRFAGGEGWKFLKIKETDWVFYSKVLGSCGNQRKQTDKARGVEDVCPGAKIHTEGQAKAS